MRTWVYPFPHCQPPEPAAPSPRPDCNPQPPRGPGAGAGPGESQLHIRTGILRRQPRRRRRAGPDCLRTAPEGSPLPPAGRMGKQQRREGTVPDPLRDPCTYQRPLYSGRLSTFLSNPCSVIGGRIPRCLSFFNSPYPNPSFPHSFLSHCLLGGPS